MVFPADRRLVGAPPEVQSQNLREFARRLNQLQLLEDGSVAPRRFGAPLDTGGGQLLEDGSVVPPSFGAPPNTGSVLLEDGSVAPNSFGAPPNREGLFRFADRLAEQVSGGRGRLNTNDPDAIQKLLNHVDRVSDDFSRQTGQPKEEIIAETLDATALADQNEELAEQIRQLGANPRVSGVGIGRDALLSANAALKNQLETLQAPLRRGGPSVAEIQSQIGPGATRFIFPDAQVTQDPAGGGFAGFARDLFTPPVGLPEEDIQNLPTPLRPVVRAGQTVASPGSLLATVGAPVALGASGLAQGAGRGAATARFIGETPGRAVLSEGLAELGAESAREAELPVAAQIGAGVAGGLAGAAIPSIAGAARRSGRAGLRDVLPVGAAEAAGPDDLGLGRSISDITDDQLANRLRAIEKDPGAIVERTLINDEITRRAAIAGTISPEDLQQAKGIPGAEAFDDAALEREVAAARTRVDDLARIAGASRIDDALEREIAFSRIELDLRNKAPTDAAIARIAAQVRDASPVSNEVRDRVRSEARSARVGSGSAVLRAGTGERAFRGALSQLEGPLPNPRFTPPVASATDLHLILERIRTSPRQFFTKINSRKGLNKILMGETPNRTELTALESTVGPEFVEAFVVGTRNATRTKTGLLLDILGVPKTIRSAFDLSFPFRQGLLLGARNPREFGAAFVDMFKSLSPAQARRINAEIFADSDMRLLREHNLFLQEIDRITPQTLARREEAFVSRWAAKLPGVRLSERTFGTFGNKLRHDVAKKTLNNWRRQGVDVTDPERLRSLSQFINIFTGRGSLGALERSPAIANMLQIGFWSPRLFLSRVQAPLLLRNPMIRREVTQNLAATFGVGMTILAMVKWSGQGDVELDPRSTDFGKIRIGRTRLDFWGGMQQIFRYMAQITTGQVKSTRTGKVFNVKDFDSNRIELGERFARSKLSPGLPTILANELFGETFLGEELGEVPDRGRPPRPVEQGVGPIPGLADVGLETAREQEAVLQLAPLFAVDLVDAMDEHGIVNGTGLAIPALFGVGTMTFNEPRRDEEIGIAQEEATR